MSHFDERDTADPDIVQLLVLEAGRLLEDASPMFTLTLPAGPNARVRTLEDMLAIATAVTAMLAAAIEFDRLASG